MHLLLEHVRDVEPGFRLTSGNSAGPMWGRSICRRLDALPLALELAAPWMKVLSPPKSFFAACATTRCRRPSYPRPSRAAADDERHRRMELSVALATAAAVSPARRPAGKVSIDAAAAVLAGDVAAAPAHDDVLLTRTAATLIDKSLLLRARGPPSVPSRPLYQMLETVRAFAVLEASARSRRARERPDGARALLRGAGARIRRKGWWATHKPDGWTGCETISRTIGPRSAG